MKFVFFKNQSIVNDGKQGDKTQESCNCSTGDGKAETESLGKMVKEFSGSLAMEDEDLSCFSSLP